MIDGAILPALRKFGEGRAQSATVETRRERVRVSFGDGLPWDEEKSWAL